MLFKDADASGLEPDARLTAMWLWTLKSGETPKASSEEPDEDDEAEDEEEKPAKSGAKGGFSSRIRRRPEDRPGAGGRPGQAPLGRRGEGEDRPAAAGSGAGGLPPGQGDLGRSRPGEEGQGRPGPGSCRGWKKPGPARGSPPRSAGMRRSDSFAAGSTTLDQVHQAMLLFARGRSDALTRLPGRGRHRQGSPVLEARPVALGPLPGRHRREALGRRGAGAEEGAGVMMEPGRLSTSVHPETPPQRTRRARRRMGSVGDLRRVLSACHLGRA